MSDLIERLRADANASLNSPSGTYTTAWEVDVLRAADALEAAQAAAHAAEHAAIKAGVEALTAQARITYLEALLDEEGINPGE